MPSRARRTRASGGEGSDLADPPEEVLVELEVGVAVEVVVAGRRAVGDRAGGAVRSARVVEVDDEPDSTAGDPDPDPDPVVGGIHQVDVVTAAVRLLALEVEMRSEHRGVRVARPAAEVLRPDVARV